MNGPGQPQGGAAAGARFDPVAAPWFFPLIVLGVLLLLRITALPITENAERLWLDLALDIRSRAGFSEPLDPAIRFVELTMNDDIARRFADDGEYATIASILKSLASLEVKVIALDILYSYGREEDQALLAAAIDEIEATTRSRVVLPAAIEFHAAPPFLLRSLPLAGGSARPAGIVNVPADRHWREYQMVYQFEGATLPSLALASYGASRPTPLAPREAAPGVMEWKVRGDEGGVVTERADERRRFLNLRHPYENKTYDKTLTSFGGRIWTIADIERLAALGESGSPLRDTIVFLGYGAEVDGKPTTHGAMEPGMLLHGTALHDLIHGTSIRRAPLWLDVAFLVLAAIVAAIAFSRIRRKRLLILVAAAGIPLLLLSGWFAIWNGHILLLPAAVSAAILWGSAAFLEVGRRWVFEQRERTRRDAMLGFYFSPAVLKQVTQNLDMIRPRGNEVAVLLSDLRGFTHLCETQPVERVFELLNRLFAVETDAALRENGSLARFAGDQFLAYWGAPEPCTDAPDRALRAALEILRELKKRRESPGADDLDGWLQIGIGLHCGRGLTGHVGSRSYRDYNIVGDCVNTTARIESQTKTYAAPILASGAFLAAVQEKPLSLLVDRVQVKGKSKATDLHALFADLDEILLSGIASYEGTFGQYLAGDFATAATGFETLTKHPDPTIATSSRLLHERCQAFIETAPAEWDGVYELTSK